MNPIEPEKEFLEYVIRAIVAHPESVVVTRTVDSTGVLLRLTVHPDDMGRVIGKEGKFAREVLRPLLHVVGAKHQIRVGFKVEEPVEGRESLFDTP